MSLMTVWGYTLTNETSLPSILSAAEYNAFTADKYASDARVASNINAAMSAVRNYCGWHVYPSEACELSTTFFDKRVTRFRRMIMVQLPATFVSSVSSVTIDGTTHTDYVLDHNGILRLYNVDWADVYPYTPIVINYTAGLTDADDVKELIAHRVTHALASSGGVQSETAGGVSITYSANWINNSRSTALADDNKEVLAPYRLRGVF